MAKFSYKSSANSHRVLQGLFSQIGLKELCDVTLETEDGLSIAVHRNVLAAVSPYFRAMFTGNLLESGKDRILLKGIAGVALQALLDYVYTSSIEIFDDNVEEVLNAACAFQIPEIINVCSEFLKEQLHPSNCLGILALADRFSCEELANEAHKYTVKHFGRVSECDEFKALPFNEIKLLLNDENICVRSEEEVFEAALAWVNASEDRCKELAEILTCVRLPILSPSYLTEHVLTNETLLADDECKLMIDEAMLYASSPSSVKRQQVYHSRMQPRMPTGFADALVAVGGLYTGNSVASAERYNMYTDEWTEFPSLLTPRYGFAITQLCGNIYCLGGYHNGEFLKAVEVFDAEQNIWISKPPMLTARKYFGADCLYGKVYAVGGSDGQHRIASVDCYDTFTKEWTATAPMLEPRMYHGVVALGGLLYAVGGHSGTVRLSSVECYDPQTDSWTKVAAMSKPRSVAGIAALNGRIYVVGGFDGHDYLKDVECYDPQTDTWLSVAPLNRARSAVSVAIMKGRLFALGGFNGQFLDSVEMFDPQENIWATVASMSIPRVHFGVTVI
ncbi:predicted protein [Nematostella vectensis]|uniref:BTB domain-containing protein n=1 Tax=Nematostella vectensis TaxID=45351 RepID=A7S0N0_NEMVE|nr:predicted protein [Nematostella vectensis]|eukprot:XP_001634764.1 predicted protein [Nematostella vectensis]